jgi:hypothetical protein
MTYSEARIQNSWAMIFMDGIAHDARKNGRKDCQKQCEYFPEIPNHILDT